MPNKRVFYAIQQVQLAPDATTVTGYTTGHAVHGLQSVGLNTNFNLDQVFEISQLAVYEHVENIPEVEATLEKAIDGYALLYHLATPNATSATLNGRSNEKCQMLLTFFDDTKDSASGTPISEVECSGMFVNALNYNMPVDGNFTESCTLTGTKKTWRSSPSGSGVFLTNTDAPIGSGGVQRREDILFGSGATKTVLPTSIRGISGINGSTASGYNIETSSIYGASIQSIRVSANLGRDNLLELGRKNPYHRFVNFPVEVTTEVECYAKDGDFVDVNPDADNTVNSMIFIYLREGTKLDLGTKNRLQSTNYGGANAGKGGGNATITYSYINFSDLKVTHPQDPAGLT